MRRPARSKSNRHDRRLRLEPLEDRRLLTGDLLITEFLADNENGLADELGVRRDWIEIYNNGPGVVDLDGWHLTDNPGNLGKWTFPAVDVDPGEYLVVFASNQNRRDPLAPLHTNFRISKGGEYLAIVEPGQAETISHEYAAPYAAQYADISYGLDPTDLITPVYFQPPTPGQPNGPGMAAPPAAPITFSHGSHTFASAFTLELTVPSPTAVIRYTINGAIPAESSTLYNPANPIQVNSSTRIRARAFDTGRSPGPVASETFIALGGSVMDFQGTGETFESNLPLMVFDSFGYNVHSQDTLMVPVAGAFIAPGEDGQTVITDEPEFGGRAGLRVRGQSSQRWPKKQYALEIWGEGHNDAVMDASVAEDREVSIFGLPAESDWVVNGPYADKSQLNNYLSFLWGNKMGTYAPRTRLVEVFLNANGGAVEYPADYLGTYVLMEKIKIDNNRVDVAQLGPTDNAEPEITGGYIWKKNQPGTGDVPWTTSRGIELRHHDPDDSEITPAQSAWLTAHVNQFEAALYGPNFTDPELGYQAYIDVDSWIDTWILVEMAKNIDGFRLSTYYHKDRDGKIKQGPAWDYNFALSNADYLEGGLPQGWYHTLIGGTDYPYWPRLFEDPHFVQRLVDRWQQLRGEVLTTENLIADIEAAVSEISGGDERLSDAGHDNPISRNFQKWTNLATYHWPNCHFSPDADCGPSPIGHAPTTYVDYIDVMKWFVEQRVAWMDGQYVTPPVIAVDGPTVTIDAPAGDVYYTLDGTDPRPRGSIDTGQDMLLADNVPAKALIPTGPVTGWNAESFNDEAWLSGNTGVGYETTGGYESFINLDVLAPMDEKNLTAYVRVPFSVDVDPAEYTSMTLWMRYDDGFVAYINGTEVARSDNVPAGVTPAWDFDELITIHDDVDAVMFVEFDITGHVQQGQNMLAIHGLNYNLTSTDFLIAPRITASRQPVGGGVFSDSAIQYTGPFIVDENARVVARAYDTSHAIAETTVWSGPTSALAIVQVPQVAVTEVNYKPAPVTPEEATDMGWSAAEMGQMENEFEFIEIKNVGAEPIELEGFQFTEGIHFTFPQMLLPSGEHVLVVRNQQAFEVRYGEGLNIAGEFTGEAVALDDDSDHVTLVGNVGETIVDFTYQDGWHPLTDGDGYTLTIVAPTADAATWNDAASWRPSDYLGGSPGTDDAGLAPPPGAVIINELISNTAGAPGDRIELFNTTDEPVDVSGWYLSDDWLDLTLARLPELNPIPGGGYLVLDEETHFGETLSLSELGGPLILQAADDAETPIGYQESVEFEAAEPGVSHGRYERSDGRTDFVRQSVASLGSVNSGPVVEQVIINEVMYHPMDGEDEFIELHNTGGSLVSLLGWAFDNGVVFMFPDIEIGPNGYVVVTRTDPAAFRAAQGVPDDVPVLGPYAGALDNGGERLTVRRPGVGGLAIVADSVRYDDVAPWSPTADGAGASLSRLDPFAYGDDSGNWASSIPGGTPGEANVIFDDTAPSTPTDLQWVLAAGPEVELSWHPAHDPQSGVDHYAVYRNGEQIGTSRSLQFLDTDVAAAVTYAYAVSAVNRSLVEGDTSPTMEVRLLGIGTVEPTGTNELRVTFTESVDAASAQTPANYLVGGDTVTGAVLQADNRTVSLATASAMADGNVYRVVVNAVTAPAGAVLPPNAQATFSLGAASTGLAAEYFNNPSFAGSPALDRIESFDPMMNRVWDAGSPDPVVNADGFSARWTGMIEPEHSENYRFAINVDDGVELLIGGQTVIDALGSGVGVHEGFIDLLAHQKHAFELKYFEDTGDAKVQMLWESASRPPQLIPADRFSVAANVEQTPPTITGVSLGGHPIADGPAQADPLPHHGLAEVRIEFSEDVDVTAADLTVTGSSPAAYSVVDFNYDFATFTAAWTIDPPIGADQVTIHLSDSVEDPAGNALDGEWTDDVDTYPSGDGTAGGDFVFRAHVLPPEVVGRHVFYNNSSFDTGGDAAIATDKTALLPGETAGFANVTSFASGINGVMIDISNLADPMLVDKNDFLFATGHDADPASWQPVAAPEISVHDGAGAYGSDRIVLTWPDGLLQNTWLQVTVRGDAAEIGLADDDIFYFGSAVGETGNSNTDTLVNAADVIGVRDHPRGLLNPAPITDPFDFNRDRQVDAVDLIVARNNATGPISALRLFTTPPAAAPLQPGEGASNAPRLDPVGVDSQVWRQINTNYLDSQAMLPFREIVKNRTSSSVPHIEAEAAADQWAADLEAELFDLL